ncbi:MAG: cobalamin B12-binding domain-containing protein, partial [Chloroflexi bacterium]|nr:cobalamin B12-binding domain-containing protein [Chloroflexota bacterium]
NRLIVAEVLQSAEAMKAAVGHLEPHMEKIEGSLKGKIILATVKGDVHDIGKNLVDIVLSNNGFQIVNLGIKVPPQDLITAYHQHKPMAIGLSGLLVKSAQMMVETVSDFTDAGIKCPVLVGGAALSNRFTRLKIAPEYEGLVVYAQDAMTGLAIANRMAKPAEREKLAREVAADTKVIQETQAARTQERVPMAPSRRSPTVRQDVPIPLPPDLKLHVLHKYDLDAIFTYINPQMLFVRHLGYRGRFAEAEAARDAKALELRQAVRRIEEVVLARPDIAASAVFKFFPAQAKGQDMLVYAPDGKTVLERFTFGRQSEADSLSLVDYIAPVESGRRDYVAMFVTTIGPGVRPLADEWREKGNYLDSHVLQALAIESAEAFAELLHQQLRKAWGFPDPAGIAKEELFKAHYHGRRYSFGYPACPRLEDQEPMFRLLEVDKHIPVKLTEGFMMDPESSVSALVFHHPDAKYFNLSSTDAEALEKALAPR